MSALANKLLDYRPSWEGIGSVSIQPIYKEQGQYGRSARIGWTVSINGDYDNREYHYRDAYDAVQEAIMRYWGEWPPTESANASE